MKKYNAEQVVEALLRLKSDIKSRLSLQADKADDLAIDEGLRAGVELKGTNLWVLIFAILVASVGLNVNSTAVIIGAMLISPLMGPIMGVGYGVGIYDFLLIRKSLKNLGISVLISILTSALYFLISPLSQAQSELLARTSPTIWDVLIGLFGGFAGIIAATRKEKSTVIPGVAIATALMPPLCTAGYGLAYWNFKYFFGAFYLFAINSVYIAVSTVIVVWLFKSPRKRFVDSKTEAKVKRYLSVVVVLTLLPSVYLAYNLVQSELFNVNARSFIQNELALTQAHIAETNIFSEKHRIEVTLIGEPVDKEKLAELENRLSRYGLAGSQLIVHQGGDQRVDVTSLKASIISDLYKESQQRIEEKERIIERLQADLQKVSKSREGWSDISQELRAQYPDIHEIALSEALDWEAGGPDRGVTVTLLYISSLPQLSSLEKSRIERWLKARVKSKNVKVIFR